MVVVKPRQRLLAFFGFACMAFVVVVYPVGRRALNPPLVVAEGDPIDVGIRMCGDPIRANFQLRNKSGRSIVIERARKYCGCVEVNAGPLPRTLEAGAGLVVEYALTPPEWEGTLRQFIEFDCEGFESAFQVKLQGEARQPLPPDVQLGSFASPHRSSIPLGPEALACGCAITQAHSLIDGVSAGVEDHALLLQFHPSLAGQPLDGAVDVVYRHCPVSAQRVWIHGLASGGLLASPDTLRLGLLTAGSSPVIREVELRDGQDRPFELKALSTTSDAIDVQCVERCAVSAILRVVVRPTRPQSIDEQIIVQTSDPGRRVVVRCLGTVEEARSTSDPRGSGLRASAGY